MVLSSTISMVLQIDLPASAHVTDRFSPKHVSVVV